MAPSSAAAGAIPLPCQNTNNCTKQVLNSISSVHRKTAYALQMNVRLLSDRHGIDRLGLLTLTFADHVLDIHEAQRRFHSLKTHVLRHRYLEWVCTVERQKSGRIHYHLVVVSASDIRSGIDFDRIAQQDYKSANSNLRSEWAFWRKTAKNYGFGRTELLPVKSTADCVAQYVGKYIAKHIGQRIEDDKGARLVRYSRGTNRASVRFTWRSPGADLWRMKLGHFVQAVGAEPAVWGPDRNRHGEPLSTGAWIGGFPVQFRQWFGENWIFILGPLIESIRLRVYPTSAHAQLDYPDKFSGNDKGPLLSDVIVNDGKDHLPSIQAAVITAHQERMRLETGVRQKHEGRQGRGVPPLRLEYILPGSDSECLSQGSIVPPVRSWLEYSSKDD